MIDMKKLISFVLSLFAVDVAFAACDLTERNLSKGSDGKYDEYLYADGSYSEMRQEGVKVKAYLCGYGACSVGDKLRLSNAAVGGNGTRADAVYECGKSSGGRDNYHWLASDVESVCAVAGAKFKYDEKLKLYVYGNKYCKQIDEVKQLANVFNIQNNTLINNITHNVDIDITQVYNKITVNNIVVKKNLSAADIQLIGRLIRKSESEIRSDLTKIGVTVAGLKKDVARLETLVNKIGVYEFVNHLDINALRSRMLAAESNQKALEALIDDVAKAGLSPQALNDVQTLIRQAAAELKVDINQKINVLNARVGALEKNDARLERLINKIGAYEFVNHLDINVLRSRMLAAESNQKALEALIDDVAKAGLSPQAVKDVQTLIRQAAADLQVDINALNARVGALEKNDVRLNALIMSVQTELAGYQKYNNANIDSLRTRILAAESNQKALEIMIQDVAAAGLSPQAVKDVQALIDAAAQDLRVDLSDIYNRLGLVESNVAALQAENEKLLNKIAGLQSLSTTQRNQIAALRQEVSKKTTVQEVVQLILDNTKNLTDGQKNEVVALIVEYTQYLSAGQKMEVEAMIRLYVDPKFQKIDRDMEKMRQQQVARDKINSAMSVLNSFAASAKVSVWKNKEGNFNTARLASDSVAGVVLGTAGGLISNHLIKKNQIKKGMEDIQCTVGGQVVAGYGDEFMVGMQ